jgi:hypothetical protein
MNDWISVKDRLPTPYAPILLCAPHPLIPDHLGWMNSDGKFRSAWVLELKNVTHWAEYTPGPYAFGVTDEVDRKWARDNADAKAKAQGKK